MVSIYLSLLRQAPEAIYLSIEARAIYLSSVVSDRWVG